MTLVMATDVPTPGGIDAQPCYYPCYGTLLLSLGACSWKRENPALLRVCESAQLVAQLSRPWIQCIVALPSLPSPLICTMALAAKLTTSTSAKLAMPQPTPFRTTVAAKTTHTTRNTYNLLVPRNAPSAVASKMSRTASAVSRRQVVRCCAALAQAEPGKTKLGFVGIGIMGLAMVSTRSVLKPEVPTHVLLAAAAMLVAVVVALKRSSPMTLFSALNPTACSVDPQPAEGRLRGCGVEQDS
jgi:hypothetical protein